MTTTKEVIIILLWHFNLALAKPHYQEKLDNFWNNAKPGELLRSLDNITSSSQLLTQPLHLKEDIEEKLPYEQIVNNFHSRRRIDEGLGENLERQTYDYNKAYEEFVKKYFDDSVTDNLSASESAENEKYDTDVYSGEEIDSKEANEPIIKASTKFKNVEKCKEIVRGQQNCLICNNQRSGEASESCYYNKEIKPKSYAFQKEKNFRKVRGNFKKVNKNAPLKSG